MASETITVRRDRLPDANVGDTVVVRVEALVTKVETEVVDISGYDQRGDMTYAPGETYTDLLVMRLAEVD